MKKIISIFLSLCIVFSLSGCKNNNSNKKVIDVAGGNGYSILLTDTGEVYYSGSYLPKITDKREGIDPYGLDKIQITAKVKQIYAGMYSVLLISDTNEGYLMGRDFMNGSVTNLYPPVKIQLPGIVKDAAIGSYGITILTQDNKVYTIGDNQKGVLGIEEKGAKKFTEVTFENKIVKVAMGGIVSLFLDEKGNAYECGSLFGRKNLWQEAPIQWLPIKIAEGIADITCGEGTIFLLNRQGEIFSRGSNERGISGTGSTEEFIPLLTKINMEEKVKFIQAANMVHCYAVTENGSFYVWGDNLEHVFDPTADFFPVPKQIELGFSPISIKPGVMHLFLFDEENNIYGFGRNRVRQLFVGQDPLEKPVLITWEAIQSK